LLGKAGYNLCQSPPLPLLPNINVNYVADETVNLIGVILVFVISLVSVLISALNALLFELARFLGDFNLLGAVAVLLTKILGAADCLLCRLGLIL
jgi:hypothetical protein